MPHAHSVLLGLSLCAGLAMPCAAQWSTDAATNLTVGDRSGEQVQPKIKPALDGGSWITWLDNAAGGYDTYIQRLDAAGNEMFPHNGILIRDTGFSSTEDYDLKIDSLGNAIVVFRDDRIQPGSTQIAAQKVAPDGTLLWGPNGLVVSTGTQGKHNPKCAVMQDDSVAVGWSVDTSPVSVNLRVVNPDGSLPAAAPTPVVDVNTTVRPLQMSDMQAGGPGEFIVLMVRCTGTNCVLSNKLLYAQKFSESGVSPMWDRDPSNAIAGEPVIVFDGTSIQTATFPTFVPDGAGGAVFAWYENGGSRRAYCQHLSSTGVENFGHNGVATLLLPAGTIQISAGLDYDASTGSIYVVSKTTFSANQNQWGIVASLVSDEAVRVWGDQGVQILPMTGVQSSFENAVALPGGGCDFFWFQNSGNPFPLKGAAYNLDASPRYGVTDVSSVLSVKGRMSVSRGILGNALVAWHDNRADANNLIAQSMLADGTLGPPAPICPQDFNHDGDVNPDDLGDYITCFFDTPPCPGADFNGDHDVNPDDLGDFITAFFGPAC